MKNIGALAVTILLTVGCAAVFARPQKAAPPASPSGTQTSSEAAYVIGPEDVLDISVWREPTVSRSVPVRLDGKISLPLLNDIQASGLTPMQLADTISEKLKKFFTNPQVTVTVTAINSQNVFAVGEVMRPGPIRMLPGMTALQAIASAGGLTQFANQKRAYVLRHEGGKDVHYPINYKELLRGDMRGNIVLKVGDTIVVP